MEKNTLEKKQPLKLPVMLGYGIGSLGESIAYNIFYGFFIFFMTSVVGLSPMIAGTISLFAVMWDAITDPMIGRISDNLKSPKGRRVPFLLYASIPLGIVIFMMFINPSLSETGKIIYYAIANLLFWLLFTSCDIPYIALGAEITDDYNERTKLRVWAQVFVGSGAAIVYSGALIVVQWFTSIFGNNIKAWAATGGIFGLITTLSFLICGYFMKGKESTIVDKNNNDIEKIKLKNLFKNYSSILKLKQYRRVIIIAFAGNLIMGIGQSTNMFIQTVAYNLTPDKIVWTGLIGSLFNILAAIVIGFIVTKWEKRQILIGGLGLFVVGFSYMWFMPHIFVNALIAQSLIYSAYGVFWTLIFSLNYDVVEIDEFINNERREGLIVSLNSFAMKIGISFGMWFVGAALEFIKFDATLSHHTSDSIFNLCLISLGLPIVVSILTLIPAITYKVNKERFEALKKALRLRAEGKEYSIEKFQDLL